MRHYRWALGLTYTHRFGSDAETVATEFTNTSVSASGDGADVSVDDVTLAAEGKSIRYTGYPGYPAYIRSTWDATGELVDEQVALPDHIVHRA